MKQHKKVIEKMKLCTACSLHKNRTQVVVGDYGPKQGICFIGEAPGYYEDKQGRPFVGKSGKLLDQMLSSIGYTRKEVSVLNINKCRPPENRKPTTQEMSTCGSLWLGQQLAYLDPKLLITLGSTALEYFINGKKITKVRGKIQFRDGKTPILPLFHPAYVLRGGQTREDYQHDFKELHLIIDKLDNDELLLPQSKSGDQSTLDDFF